MAEITVSEIMNKKSPLTEYLSRHGISQVALCSDGALVNPARFPVASVEVTAAVLFADLTGYSRIARNLSPAECAYLVSQFFAWFEGEASQNYGGMVDKFIGDELMMVFLPDTVSGSPLEAALRTTKAMLTNDPYAFEPKIGIALGTIAVALVGTESTSAVTVMGHTVNIAARCVQTASSSSLRVASADMALVTAVFDELNDWDVSAAAVCDLKNIGPTEVIDIKRLTVFVPNFDRYTDIRLAVARAKELGVVVVKERGSA